MGKPSKAELKQISSLVDLFKSKQDIFRRFAKTLHDDIVESSDLRPFVHFAKFRVKDPEHLRGKLLRKLYDAKSKDQPFGITDKNLFRKIHDLGGVRILHLHTAQMEKINPLLMDLFAEQNYKVVEGPVANLWDHEYAEFFRKIGIEARLRGDTMYTSVHYIVQASNTFRATCEIQVRTLTEELWGEVSHTINYPKSTDSVACAEQLKVLARVASSATRLVDAIFKSHEDHVKDGGGSRE